MRKLTAKRKAYQQKLATGAIFGKLVVIEDRGSTCVLCLCECLNTRTVYRSRLKRGTVTACEECSNLHNQVAVSRGDLAL